jgi:hypothetical protein
MRPRRSPQPFDCITYSMTRVNWTEALGEVLGLVGKVLSRSSPQGERLIWLERATCPKSVRDHGGRLAQSRSATTARFEVLQDCVGTFVDAGSSDSLERIATHLRSSGIWCGRDSIVHGLVPDHLPRSGRDPIRAIHDAPGISAAVCGWALRQTVARSRPSLPGQKRRCFGARASARWRWCDLPPIFWTTESWKILV